MYFNLIDQKQNLKRVFEFFFLSSEIKNVTVSLRTSATNWMNITYMKRSVLDKPIKSSFEILLAGTWKDAETEIKKMGKNKVEAPSGRM